MINIKILTYNISWEAMKGEKFGTICVNSARKMLRNNGISAWKMWLNSLININRMTLYVYKRPLVGKNYWSCLSHYQGCRIIDINRAQKINSVKCNPTSLGSNRDQE